MTTSPPWTYDQVAAWLAARNERVAAEKTAELRAARAIPADWTVVADNRPHLSDDA